MLCVFFFKQKTAYEMRISDWSSDVCSSDLYLAEQPGLDVLACDGLGRNALALACLSPRNAPEVLTLLLAIGVDREQCDQHGKRPIEHAMAAGRWRLVAVLEPEQELPSRIYGDAIEGDNDHRTPAQLFRAALAAGDFAQEVVSASCRDRGCWYAENTVVAD